MKSTFTGLKFRLQLGDLAGDTVSTWIAFFAFFFFNKQRLPCHLFFFFFCKVDLRLRQINSPLSQLVN